MKGASTVDTAISNLQKDYFAAAASRAGIGYGGFVCLVVLGKVIFIPVHELSKKLALV